MQMNRNSKSSASNDESIKLAIAISFLRSKLRLVQNQSTQPSSKSEALRWKRKCYFFDNLGKLSPKIDGDASHRRFNGVLRRRFLKQVRLKERRRRRTGDRDSTRWRRFTASLKNLLSEGKSNEAIEGIISSLIMRLVKRMYSPLKQDGADLESLHIDDDSQFCIQHLIHKLASEAYIGQRVKFSVSQYARVHVSNLSTSVMYLLS
ncbi:hypothetical protein Patl1_14532 [Pistacia atlantica]|uniref:Uncharacterized protein n=1 Tax=Pistacia atlantica TaxID=434234 RepID=A0ACC1AV01_9ROSI|nr:hypothetical protein Patl1_14532 [Pistacia atlantica]